MSFTPHQRDLFEDDDIIDANLIPNISNISGSNSYNFNFGGISGSGGIIGPSGPTGSITFNNPNTYNYNAGHYSVNPGSIPYISVKDDYANTTTKSLLVNGDAEFKGEVVINGKKLSDTIENIEKRLAILHPNSELEQNWEELRELGDRYRELEKQILEKEKIINILKK